MLQEQHPEKNDLIPYEEKPITEAPPREEEKEKIKVYEDVRCINWKECFMKYWSFFAVTTAFAAIFLLTFILINPEMIDAPARSDESTCHIEDDIPVAVLPEDNAGQQTENESQILIPPIVLDESMIGFEIDGQIEEGYSLAPLMGASDGVKVIIMHSHTSEFVSESLQVTSVGEVLSQILNSGGIKSFHCKNAHDSEGTIGAYERMNESLAELREDYPEAVLVIDLHNSDSGKPLTLTIGTGFDYGWNENLKAACAISTYTTDIERAIRLLPGDLGQNNGIITLNIGICGKEYSDEEARKVIASLAEALMIICENNTPADG